jgi:polyisoprenoid-binding protein YceI
MRALTFVLACTVAATAPLSGQTVPGQAVPPTPLALHSARVSLDGTSNVHAYTASTTTVLVRAIEIGGTLGEDPLDRVLQPGALKTFEVSIPTTGLTSPKEGIDKNMHKALKAEQHKDIRFRLRALETTGDAYRAVGSLTIAGVEKEATLSVKVERKGAMLLVTGATDLLMTDYGITPPKAMLGMLKTDPKVTIRIELTLGELPPS